jgi:hypothetical protein
MMIEYWLRAVKRPIARVFRVLSLLNPRRIVRYFRSVSSRLDALGRLLEAQSAGTQSAMCGFELLRGTTLELERRIGLIEQKLDQIGSWEKRLEETVCSQFASQALLLKAETSQVQGAIASGVD